MTPPLPSNGSSLLIAELLLAIPPGCRGAVVQSAASFRPDATLDASFSVGPLRAAFAEFWEAQEGGPVPIVGLRAALAPPVPIATVLAFSKLSIASDATEIDQTLCQLVTHLCERLRLGM